VDTETNTSPFAGLSYVEAPVLDQEQPPVESGESPFDSLYTTESPFGEDVFTEADAEADEAADFLESIHDEDFDEALEQLLNEGAAHVLADAQQWAAPPSESEAREAVEQWIAPLVAEWERAVDGLGAGLESADLQGIAEQELDELLDSLESPAGFDSEVFDNFLGKLVRKAKSFIKQKVQQAVKFVKNPVKGVVEAAKSGLQTIKSGVQVIGKHLVGPLLVKLKNVGLKLLKGVVAKLMAPLSRLLPAPVRPLLPIVMKKLGIGEVADDESDEATSDEMVIVKEIDFYSLCEHHLLPFFGKCHIAYLPTKKVVGLSKLPRLVEIYARRFQIQERLTQEIASNLQKLVGAQGVGVVVEAQHLCMMMRGVEKQNSYAITSALLGRFRDDARTRAEFINLIQHRRHGVV